MEVARAEDFDDAGGGARLFAADAFARTWTYTRKDPDTRDVSSAGFARLHVSLSESASVGCVQGSFQGAQLVELLFHH
jgi:hypothetical protein